MVYTNKIPCGHMRSPGDPQGFFANESQLDMIAKKLGMDPLKFRQKNLMHDGDVDPIGEEVGYIKTEETLKQALENSGYHRPKAKNVGRGMAFVQWMANGGIGTVALTLDEKGIVTISSAMVDQGAGTYTAMRQIVAKELQVPVQQVRFQILDTSRAAADTGVGASRATRIFGNSTHAAAIRSRTNCCRGRGRCWCGCRRAFLTGIGSIRATSGKQVAYSAIVNISARRFAAKGVQNFVNGPEAAMVVQVAEVEVDAGTGQVMLRNFTTAHSTGTIINPLMHQGQIDGGVVTAVGYSLMEQLVIEQGKVLTANFGESKIPSIRDIPPLKTVIQEFPVGNGPYGAMSIGEPPVLVAAAAIANAVEDAGGVRIKDLPITAEKVFRAIKKNGYWRWDGSGLTTITPVFTLPCGAPYSC
jgi:CO/xanthine dehydrogenase Mo-binding subunit